MTQERRRSGPISATELLAQLAADGDYQRARQKDEAARASVASELSRAEQPILVDLRQAGIRVESVWDLVNTAEPYPSALPVLIDHLERGAYPSRVLNSLGRALAVRDSERYWERLKAVYLSTRDAGAMDGAAVALAAAASENVLDDLISFIDVEDRGETRIYFVRPILRVGGEVGLGLVRALQHDPFFAKEARLALRGRRLLDR
ncbi:hypothetical protein [Microbacterium sp. RU33B]|uniref:hypothetical protein n=1 Tax=Microbacterium sp. RU33B TaxID=1907390 RepID=UPI00095A0BF6|nr:hypothetical protein [Microbacterium sp. RU33B]SIT72057.1 hypothetical protein SAMN05880545_0989 [Microbacterium sp. RU33B]